MTVKEASKTVEGYLPDCDTRKFVLDILERAEKKKPTFVMRNFSEELCCSILHGHCPSCRKISLNWSAFCSNCGQALDWSNVE